jgi:hypothetical protein
MMRGSGLVRRILRSFGGSTPPQDDSEPRRLRIRAQGRGFFGRGLFSQT